VLHVPWSDIMRVVTPCVHKHPPCRKDMRTQPKLSHVPQTSAPSTLHSSLPEGAQTHKPKVLKVSINPQQSCCSTLYPRCCRHPCAQVVKVPPAPSVAGTPWPKRRRYPLPEASQAPPFPKCRRYPPPNASQMPPVPKCRRYPPPEVSQVPPVHV